MSDSGSSSSAHRIPHILNYKDILENYSETPRLVMLVLDELLKFEGITNDLLKTTDIATTVGRLRYHEGCVGRVSRCLVSAWKQIASSKSPSIKTDSENGELSTSESNEDNSQAKPATDVKSEVASISPRAITKKRKFESVESHMRSTRFQTAALKVNEPRAAKQPPKTKALNQCQTVSKTSDHVEAGQSDRTGKKSKEIHSSSAAELPSSKQSNITLSKRQSSGTRASADFQFAVPVVPSNHYTCTTSGVDFKSPPQESDCKVTQWLKSLPDQFEPLQDALDSAPTGYRRSQRPDSSKIKISSDEKAKAVAPSGGKKRPATESNVSSRESVEQIMPSNAHCETQAKKKRMAPAATKTYQLSNSPEGQRPVDPESLSDKVMVSAATKGIRGQKRKQGSPTETYASDVATPLGLAAVSAGRKRSLSAVELLDEEYLQLLSIHIDDMGNLGGIPYGLVEPVLKRASARQLYSIERCNDEFITRTDLLWKEHCAREFQGQHPAPFECWRSAYWRMFNERKERFDALHSKIVTRERQKRFEANKAMATYTVNLALKEEPQQFDSGSGAAQGRTMAFVKEQSILPIPRGCTTLALSTRFTRAVRPSILAPLAEKRRKLMSDTDE